MPLTELSYLRMIQISDHTHFGVVGFDLGFILFAVGVFGLVC